jgi:hypothetical protein
MGNSKGRGLTLFSFIIKDDNWLVVSTPPKNISQLGLLFPIYGKNMFQTTNQIWNYAHHISRG